MNLIPKKSLGQNFLTSQGALNMIVEAADLHPHNIILEVGPGKGALTEKLLVRDVKVITVEKDDRLIPFLKERFSEEIREEKLILVHQDILNFDPASYGLTTGSYKIVANIPYYITGAFIRRFLETPAQPGHMVILVQKEVAQRIIAKDGKESLFSISVKAFGMPKYIETVKAGSFSPAPNVDSAILSISHISKDFFKNCEAEAFFKVIHAGFAHKRKQLGGNLTALAPKEKVASVLEQLGISPKTRAEDLTLEQWKQIAQPLH